MLKSKDITLPTKVCAVKATVFPHSCTDVRVGLQRKFSAKELMLLNCGVGARRSNQSILKEISPEYSLEGLTWSWNSNTLATWCQESTHLKRPWSWGWLKAGREGNNRKWDGWMASPSRWTWVWVRSGFGHGQEGLVCCSPRGCKESDVIERLNWTEKWNSWILNN